MQIAEVMCKIVDLRLATGAESIKDLPGCWEYEFGPYRISLNGHSEPIRNRQGIEVGRFGCYVSHNGFPFAVFNVAGGTIIGAPHVNEDAFIADLDAEIARLSLSGGRSRERAKR